MQRFYINTPFDKNYSITDIDILYQLIKVMRIKTWDKIILFNWEESLDYIYEISEIKKREIILNFIEKIKKNSELDFELNLYQASPNKSEKIEYILQKWVEVWFKKFIFFKSSRTQKLNISENKLVRLHKIIIEAVEQSRGNIIPELIFEEKQNFDVIGNNIFFHTENNNSKNLKDIKINYSQPINLFVWPEWWWDEEEIQNFEKNKFQKTYLWDRILRTETVGIITGGYLVLIK